MSDNPDGSFTIYNQLFLESITKLSEQTEELKKQYATLEKSISLLKQAYEVNRVANRQAVNDLIAQVKRISDVVEEFSCREHAERLGTFQNRISALEASITQSKWASHFISQFFQKTGWLFGALIMGSAGYILYLVAMTAFQGR